MAAVTSREGARTEGACQDVRVRVIVLIERRLAATPAATFQDRRQELYFKMIASLTPEERAEWFDLSEE
jgi:hypothetical protein